MARKKKQLKAKEPVRIRFKELTNGNQSIYLDIYQNGKRSYDFLKLYLIPETDESSKLKNQNTLQDAKAIQAQRIIDIANGKAGIDKGHINILLVDWLRSYQELRAQTGQSGKRAESIGNTIKHIEIYNGGRVVTMGDVDTDYCKGFINYLSCSAMSRTYTKNPQHLSKSAANSYFVCLTSALKEAVRQKIILSNSIDMLSNEDRKPIKPQQTNVDYLTAEELKLLINCNYKRQNKVLRQAFLFACLTGLRISDIRSLIWANIKVVGDSLFIHKKMVKTNTYIDVPLPSQALYYLPNRDDKNNDDAVFPTAERWDNKATESLPIAEWCINTELRRWVQKAGINKHVTFHVSRHTYATLLITQGADLFTVQKLLGHKNIQTTQIYAELVGKKKIETVKLLNDLNI